MQPLLTNVAALAVAVLFYLWRAYDQVQQRRRCILCRRVAYLLWSAAEQMKNDDTPLPETCVVPFHPPGAAR